MPEYTPTTDEVKRGYTAPRRAMVERLPGGETLGAWIQRQNAVPQHALNAFSDEAFDRWLAARDRENRAIGWDAAVKTVLTVPPGLDGWANPYRGDNRPEPGPTCAECGQPSTYRLGMPEPSWCDAHGPKPKGAPHV